jgi:alkylated DNA repair dioxygenase AlkB
MMLFNDTEIFTSGTRGKKIFDLPDADLVLIDNFIPKEVADFYYNTFLNNTKWKEYEMEIFDKTVTAPRLISWHEEKTKTSETDQNLWNPELLEIRKKVETETQLKFNAVLLNLYRNGNDGVAWHSDHTDKSGINPIIASVSFGETRMFRLRHKFRKDIGQIEIPLFHGSFLLMAGTTNSYWQHQVPKTAKDILPRINLTFRRIIH